MKHCEHHKTIVDEQYGGRTGRAAIDVVLLKECTLAIMHLQRSNGAITDCDAKACYDRILAIIATLTNAKAGLPEHLCTFFAKALEQMRYHMVTAYGVSEEYKQHSEAQPSQAVGRG